MLLCDESVVFDSKRVSAHSSSKNRILENSRDDGDIKDKNIGMTASHFLFLEGSPEPSSLRPELSASEERRRAFY